MTETSVILERTTCWCGTPFMLPSRLLESARNSGRTIYCPHGHSIVWKETMWARLRRDRDRLKQQEAMLHEQIAAERVRADKAEAATKRLKKRASAGTCPCCQRTFSNMATHMKRQHPEFVAEGGANVVPLKAHA